MTTPTGAALSITVAASLAVGVVTLSANLETNLYSVVRITDGDTVVLRRADEVIRVRLLCIDAPELRQKYGQASRSYLQSRLRESNGKIFVHPNGKDRYGRTLGYLQTRSGEYLNLSIVREGLAYYDPRYKNCNDPAVYEIAQQSAKESGLGVWQESVQEYPWVWRKQRAGGV